MLIKTRVKIIPKRLISNVNNRLLNVNKRSLNVSERLLNVN